MKKIICLMLAIMTVFTTVSVFASGEDVSVKEGLRLSYDGIYCDEIQSGKASISVKLENNTDAVANVTFVVAEYSADDNGFSKLVNVKTQTLGIAASTAQPFNVEFSVSNVENSVKVFAYSSSNVGSINLGGFVLDKFQYIGTGDDGTSIYKINRFAD